MADERLAKDGLSFPEELLLEIMSLLLGLNEHPPHNSSGAER
jgi:hypothetical protein